MFEKNFQTRRVFATFAYKLFSKRGGFMEKTKKDNKRKERKVYIVGRPKFEQLSKSERNAFCSTLLSCIVDYNKKQNNT